MRKAGARAICFTDNRLNLCLPRVLSQPIAGTAQKDDNQRPKTAIADMGVRVGGKGGGRGSKAARLAKLQAVEQATMRVKRRRNAGIGGPHQGQALFNGPQAGLRQMLVWPVPLTEPAIIGQIDNQAGRGTAGQIGKIAS